jgi:hypothetical protein
MRQKSGTIISEKGDWNKYPIDRFAGRDIDLRWQLRDYHRIPLPVSTGHKRGYRPIVLSRGRE